MMKFKVEDQSLYKQDGSLLKKLSCPLKKNWDALVKDDSTPLKRYCNSCSKDVINITDMDEQQIEQILQIDSKSCFCIMKDSKHIEWIEHPEKELYEEIQCLLHHGKEKINCPIVKTARTASQINSNHDGYHVLIRPVYIDEHIRYKVKLTDSEKGYSGYDYRTYMRYDPDGFFNSQSGIPKDPTNWWFPLKSTFPFAAYLIPEDVKIGQKVYVPDIIQNFIKSSWNQGDVFRLESGYGIWTGHDIQFDFPTQTKEATSIIG